MICMKENILIELISSIYSQEKSELKYLYGSGFPRRNGLRSIPIFVCTKISHALRHSSFFAKSHAWLACSVVNTLATARCRYQLFASMRLSVQGYLNRSLRPKKRQTPLGSVVFSTKYALRWVK